MFVWNDAISNKSYWDVMFMNITIPETDFGVFVGNSSNVQLSHVNVSNSFSAMSIHGTDNITCNNISISECDHIGIDISDGNDINIQNTTIYNATTYGIRTNQTSQVLILDTMINDAGTGIIMDSGDSIRMSKITSSNIFSIGLYLRYSNQTIITDLSIDNAYI